MGGVNRDCIFHGRWHVVGCSVHCTTVPPADLQREIKTRLITQQEWKRECTWFFILLPLHQPTMSIGPAKCGDPRVTSPARTTPQPEEETREGGRDEEGDLSEHPTDECSQEQSREVRDTTSSTTSVQSRKNGPKLLSLFRRNHSHDEIIHRGFSQFDCYLC